MSKSHFKETYNFLHKYFVLMTAKPKELEYKPGTYDFFRDYYDYFEIKIMKTDLHYELQFCGIEKEKSKTLKFNTEEELVEALIQNMEKRKIIGDIKKIFSP